MQKYEAVIGLETHIQLNTQSKIFCACKADSWEDHPNTNICPVCTGLPGVLPVLNQAAVEKAILLAGAVGASVRRVSFFDRKNYFYPDLPKGYQISQYDRSIAVGGHLDIPLPDGGFRRVRIQKLHLEEDAGKTKNENNRRLIDFNRCGVPLVELVTAPDLRSADEAAQYLIRLRQLLRWIGISEANMEKGHLRADANVSIRPGGSQALNTKTEIKNVNSIEALRSAIANEIARQIREVEAGNAIQPWTLDWDDDSQTLRKMRTKETEDDYRYFREPDLLPIVVEETWSQALLAELPELPLVRRARFMERYKLPEYDANILTNERSLSDYFEETIDSYSGDPKTVSNWIMNDVLRLLNEGGMTAADLRITPLHLAQAIELVDTKVINSTTGRALIPKMQETGKNPGALVEEEGLAAVRDVDALQAIVQKVLSENPEEVAIYQGGKTSILGWFVGQVMRGSRGKADPQSVKKLLEEGLAKHLEEEGDR